MKHAAIFHYFDELISSHNLGLAKENQGFWNQLQKVEPFEPSRTILFDDSLSVLYQAQREGIKYLYGILKPDSQKPKVINSEFPLVEDFKDLLPIAI
jgi:putative hydrolase of the HAD superfamily